MAPRTSPGSPKLGIAIRERREALGLTIEEAAKRSGVGTKTWSRYESGSSIRADKVPRVLKALGWKELLDCDSNHLDDPFSEVDESHEAWSKYLNENYGRLTAASFAVGSDIVLDHAKEDLAELARLPKGTHMGELGASWLADELPAQFLPRYDYEFVYALVHYIERLRQQAKLGRRIVARTVIEELVLYLVESEACAYIELFDAEIDLSDECPEGLAGELCGDADLEMWLYSKTFLVQAGHAYHFDSWLEEQFYLDR